MKDNFRDLKNKIKRRKIGLIGYGSIGKRHYKNLREIFSSITVYDPKFKEKKKTKRNL